MTAIGGATPDELAKCPRAVHAADSVPASFAPPAGTPTLDDLFPHLASLAFAPGTTTLHFFPCDDECAGAIEAGPNAMGDLLFAPHAFSDAEEFLLAADAAAAKGPDATVRDDAYSRLVFPVRMAKAQDKKYAKLVAQLSAFDKAMAKMHGGSSVISIDRRARQRTVRLSGHVSQPAWATSLRSATGRRALSLPRPAG